MRQTNQIRVWVACSVLLGLLCASAPALAFQQEYQQGKLLLRQKLYVDAVRALYKVVNQTARGKKHFGAHYYLAIAYYKLGNITQSMKYLARAKTFIKNRKQREFHSLMMKKIKVLFGPLRIIPEADPDAVGRLLLSLEVKTAFSNSQKRRAYRIIRKFWSKKGIALKGATLYLPKGDYTIAIAQPQCLMYGLTLGNTIVTDVAISSQMSTFALKAKRSCDCKGGQVPVKKKDKVVCSCPKNTVWSTKRNRCEIPPKLPSQQPWIANNWGWIVGGVLVAGAIGGGVATFVAINNAPKVVVFEPDSVVVNIAKK
jgi:hypothetical protein